MSVLKTPASYAHQAVVVTVGGFPISGFADGEFIQVEAMGENITRTKGADATTFNLAGDDDLQVTMRLLAHHQGYKYLYDLYVAQRAAMRTAGVVAPLAFYMLDPSNGSTITSQYTYFLSHITESKGVEEAVIEVVIALPNAVQSSTLANLIA